MASVAAVPTLAALSSTVVVRAGADFLDIGHALLYGSRASSPKNW
jgi:hypothetical protein